MVDIVMYSTPWCPFCVRAKRLLKDKGVTVTDIDISGSGELRQEMIQRSGQRTVPQIWIGERHVGGCDELYALERQGQLDSLLAQ
ncbi:glutaredoxin 3 [Alcanivorax sp. 1008]|uniref:glutaredoxin 3 n=1 Tax=Alcanivorax sp. 1008 TaxID=2816853 RepID=UPI001D9A8357|nr:glutaredoxin 3 [Alcanivorax sp. 1008]MCC1495799.1 glutaredoxin 3 [Alcanivorax sp. 1008]